MGEGFTIHLNLGKIGWGQAQRTRHLVIAYVMQFLFLPSEFVIGERLVDDKFGNAKYIVLTHSFSLNMSPWHIKHHSYIYTHTNTHILSSKKSMDERGGESFICDTWLHTWLLVHVIILLP